MRIAAQRAAALLSAGCLMFALNAFAQDEAPVAAESGSGAEAVAPDPNAPVISFDATTLDLGEVPKGDKAQYVFTFKNTGGSDLIIDSAKPSCGCTVAEFTKTVKAGESGTIDATIDTKRFRGPISKTITINSDDPANAKVHLQAKATVKPFLDLLPSQHVFLRADRGEAAFKKVTLVSYEEELDLQIDKIESSDPLITVESTAIDETKVDEEGNPIEGDYELEISLSATAPVGRVSATVDLFTNSTKVEKMTMQVRGNVRGLVQVRPSRVFLGNLPEKVEEPITKTIRVTHRGGAELEIQKVESSFEGMQATVSSVENGAAHEVVLTINGELPRGTFDERVTIFTNDADEPEIEVRVRGQIG